MKPASVIGRAPPPVLPVVLLLCQPVKDLVHPRQFFTSDSLLYISLL